MFYLYLMMVLLTSVGWADDGVVVRAVVTHDDVLTQHAEVLVEQAQTLAAQEAEIAVLRAELEARKATPTPLAEPDDYPPPLPVAPPKYQCYLVDENKEPPEAHAVVHNNVHGYAIQLLIGGKAIGVIGSAGPHVGRTTDNRTVKLLDPGQSCYLAVMDDLVPQRLTVQAEAYRPKTWTGHVAPRAGMSEGVDAPNLFRPAFSGCHASIGVYARQFEDGGNSIRFTNNRFSPGECR